MLVLTKHSMAGCVDTVATCSSPTLCDSHTNWLHSNENTLAFLLLTCKAGPCVAPQQQHHTCEQSDQQHIHQAHHNVSHQRACPPCAGAFPAHIPGPHAVAASTGATQRARPAGRTLCSEVLLPYCCPVLEPSGDAVVLVQLLVGEHAPAAICWRAGRSIGAPAHKKDRSVAFDCCDALVYTRVTGMPRRTKHKESRHGNEVITPTGYMWQHTCMQ